MGGKGIKIMTNKLIPCGLDAGNGWFKICLDGKCSKIPNWHTDQQPKGALTKRNVVSKPMAFPLEIAGKSLWFGQDTLGRQGIQQVDEDKLKPQYIKMLFKAVLWRWLSQHNIDPDWLTGKRLNVICGMPPEKYQDRQAQNRAFRAYNAAFKANKPDYIKIPDLAAIPFFTRLAGIKPETLSWRAANKLEEGYTLIADLGYGTSDLVIFHSEHDLPVSTVSHDNGLLHSHYQTNPAQPERVELDTMRKSNNHLEFYSNKTKRIIQETTRRLNKMNVNLAQLAVFGGGIKLFDSDDIKDLKTYASKYWQGDEFTNVRMFERLANNG